MPSKQYPGEVKARRGKIISFDDYPSCLDVVRNLDTLRPHPAVTYVIGENGSRKSLLPEVIAAAWDFYPEGGTEIFDFDTGSSHASCETTKDGSRFPALNAGQRGMS